MSKINLVNASHSGNYRDYLARNGEWEILGFPVVRHVVPYPEYGTYSEIAMWIVMKRKVLYYQFTLILPSICITFTTCLVFYLPVDSGEKCALSVTTLLAMTVFLLMVAESMPPQSDSVPLIEAYFGATIIILALVTSFTVVIINVHHRGKLGKKVPNFVQILVLRWVAKMMFIKETVDRNTCLQERIHVRKQCDGQEWTLVAYVIDRFMFLVFAVMTATVSLGILLNHPDYNNDIQAYIDSIDEKIEYRQNL